MVAERTRTSGASPQRIRRFSPSMCGCRPYSTASGFEALHVTMAHAIAVAALPAHDADPFDRLLIVQAQLEDLTIATSDAAFDGYDVKVLDARA